MVSYPEYERLTILQITSNPTLLIFSIACTIIVIIGIIMLIISTVGIKKREHGDGLLIFSSIVLIIITIVYIIGIENTYYIEQQYFTPNSTGIYVPLGDMSVTFTTNQTVKLYVLFTCYARIETLSGDTVFVNIYLNETTFNSFPYYINAIGYQSIERYSVNIQAYNQSLPVGTYNVSIKVRVDDLNTDFYLNSLFVQTKT